MPTYYRHLDLKRKIRKVCSNNSLIISDELMLPADTFTFVSTCHGSTSWLDHVVSTTSDHTLVRVCI